MIRLESNRAGVAAASPDDDFDVNGLWNHMNLTQHSRLAIRSRERS